MEGITFYFAWEVALMEWLQSLMGPVAVTVASVLSMLGEEMLLIAVMGFLYWCYDKEFGRFIGTNIVVGIVANPLLKNIVLRRRPYFDNETIKILKPVDKSADIYDISAQGYSFPSGHSMNSAIVYGTLPAYKKNNKVFLVIAVVLPILVGLSRVMVGAHYPTDVLVGWVCGAAIVLGISALQRKVKNENLLHLVIFLISCIGIFYCRTNDYFTGLGIMAGFFLSVPFEKKFVNFPETRKVIPSILRLAGGFALYLGLNSFLKMPFSPAFLESQTMAAYLVRSVRYAVVIFVMLAVYPMLFGKLPIFKETRG